MAADSKWLLELFKEDHWIRSENPLRAPIGTYARHVVLDDEFLGQEDRGSPTKRKRKNGPNVPLQRYTVPPARYVAIFMRKCGGMTIERNDQ
jgi:hypothetical protein